MKLSCLVGLCAFASSLNAQATWHIDSVPAEGSVHAVLRPSVGTELIMRVSCAPAAGVTLGFDAGRGSAYDAAGIGGFGMLQWVFADFTVGFDGASKFSTRVMLSRPNLAMPLPPTSVYVPDYYRSDQILRRLRGAKVFWLQYSMGGYKQLSQFDLPSDTAQVIERIHRACGLPFAG